MFNFSIFSDFLTTYFSIFSAGHWSKRILCQPLFKSTRQTTNLQRKLWASIHRSHRTILQCQSSATVSVRGWRCWGLWIHEMGRGQAQRRRTKGFKVPWNLYGTSGQRAGQRTGCDGHFGLCNLQFSSGNFPRFFSKIFSDFFISFLDFFSISLLFPNLFRLFFWFFSDFFDHFYCFRTSLTLVCQFWSLPIKKPF